MIGRPLISQREWYASMDDLRNASVSPSPEVEHVLESVRELNWQASVGGGGFVEALCWREAVARLGPPARLWAATDVPWPLRSQPGVIVSQLQLCCCF